MKPRTISPEESARILALFSQGLTRAQIAEMTGRPKPTIKMHIRLQLMSPEERQIRRQKLNQHRRVEYSADKRPYARFSVKKDGLGTLVEHPSERPPEHVLAERDRRLSRPISIQHDLLGEPEFSRSALGRKMEAHLA